MAYNGITLFDNVQYNYLVVKKRSATENEIALFNKSDYVPNWADINGAMIVADFDNTLVSSYISGLPTQFTSWAVYRKKEGESVERFVGRVERNRLYILDYICANQTEYSYYVIPETNGEMGVSMQTPTIKTDWWNYSITSLKEISNGIYVADKVWLFDFNVVSTEIVQNTDVTTFKTFTRIPKISKGSNNYQTMGISCLLGGVNSATEKYEDDIKTLQAWQEFVSQETLCLWKDRKGSIKVGVISDSPTSKYMDETIEQVTTISFNFTETMDVNDISVYNSQESIVSNSYIDVTTLIGQKITISNIGTKTAKDTVTRFTVLSNTEYTISVNSKEGYITPDYQLITTGDEGSVTSVKFDYKVDPTYVPKEKIDVSANIVWDDNFDEYEYRPSTITINLFKDEEFSESKEIKSSDSVCTFSGLDKYNSDGSTINYTFTQNEIEHYETSISNNTITNEFEGIKIDTPVTEDSAKAFVKADYIRRMDYTNISVTKEYEGDEYFVFAVKDGDTSLVLDRYTIYLNGNVEIE